jgi:hypothetical protein
VGDKDQIADWAIKAVLRVGKGRGFIVEKEWVAHVSSWPENGHRNG